VQNVVHKVGTHTARTNYEMFMLIPTVYTVLIKY